MYFVLELIFGIFSMVNAPMLSSNNLHLMKVLINCVEESIYCEQEITKWHAMLKRSAWNSEEFPRL